MILALCAFGCAALFAGIGVYAWRRKEPMWFWSGSKVNREEIDDIAAYNRANGLMWIAYSLPYWASGLLAAWGSPAVGAILLFAASMAGSVALVIVYNRIYRRYAKRK